MDQSDNDPLVETLPLSWEIFRDAAWDRERRIDAEMCAGLFPDGKPFLDAQGRRLCYADPPLLLTPERVLREAWLDHVATVEHHVAQWRRHVEAGLSVLGVDAAARARVEALFAGGFAIRVPDEVLRQLGLKPPATPERP